MVADEETTYMINSFEINYLNQAPHSWGFLFVE